MEDDVMVRVTAAVQRGRDGDLVRGALDEVVRALVEGSTEPLPED